MAPAAAVHKPSTQKGAWRPTKVMNMVDLSRDDDFLSHLLVEKLGNAEVPLVVHKMDPARKLPKQEPDELLQIVRRMITAKSVPVVAIRDAVDDLLRLLAVKYYLQLQQYDQKQVNAFATHASRYFELYLPGGSIEIAHTSRYAHRTGKSELCILATRPLHPGMVISELKGSMADLTDEEDMELKRTDGRHADGVPIRRDFSVIHSKQMKKNHLFLGPARFVNHDCDNNVELFREGRYITFRVIKMIGVGEEVTAHYGDGYFGENNCHCLCATCEKNGRGGYGPQDVRDEASDSGAEAVQGADSDHGESDDEDEAPQPESSARRTRNAVYVVVPTKKRPGQADPSPAERDLGEGSSDHSSLHGSSSSSNSSRAPLSSSDATSLPAASCHSGISSPVDDIGLPTPEPESEPRGRGMTKGKGRAGSVASNSTSPDKTARSRSSTVVPFKSVIATRAQKAREASMGASTTSRALRESSSARSRSAVRQLVTPPLTSESNTPSASNSVRSSSRIRSRPGAVDASQRSTPLPDRKGKSRATESVSDLRDMDKDEPDVRHLRPRAPVPVFDQHGMSLKKPLDAPRGLDGKPLPTCITCGSVLPVISVDSKVVWGLALGRTGKRGRPKKNLQVECPRCIRHFTIYGRKWPERHGSDGSVPFVLAPRPTGAPYLPPQNGSEEHGRTVGRPSKRQHDADEAEGSNKKQKTKEPRPRGRPPKNKVGMSDQAKQMLSLDLGATSDGRRSGRARVPTYKVRSGDTVQTRLSPRKNTIPSSPLTATPDSPGRTVPGTPGSAGPSGPFSSPKSLAVAAQPRETNGRFGKKESTNGKYVRKFNKYHAKRYMSGLRPSNRSSMVRPTDQENDGYDDDWQDESDDEGDQERVSFASPRVEIGEEALEDMVLKRSRDSDDSDTYSPKRVRMGEEDSGDSETSPQSSPRYFLGQASLVRPNPMCFARRKWATSDTLDDDLPPHREPVDDDDADDDVVIVASAEVTVVEKVARGPAQLMPAADISDVRPVVRLSMRPNPANFARRRWGPSLTEDSQAEESFRDKVAAATAEEAGPSTHGLLGRTRLWPSYSDDTNEYSDEAYSDYSDYSSEDEDYLLEDSIQFRRAMSMSIEEDSTDDSERVVERLLDSSTPTDSTLPTDSSRSPSTPPPASPVALPLEKSPGYKWKQTVLIPVDAPRCLTTAWLLGPIAPSPRTLTHTGWDTTSSDIDQ